MLLIESHQIRPGDERYAELERITKLSNNLYNSALYQWRQAFFCGVGLPEYGDICHMFALSDNPDYRALPAKVAQQTIKGVFMALSSFQGLLRSENVEGWKVNIPNYRARGGKYTATYTSQAISKPELATESIVRLSGTNVRVKTQQTASDVHQVRVVPHNGYITIEVVYEATESSMIEDNGRYASIDAGVNNLATVGFNFRRGFIIRGGPLKSIIQYEAKKNAMLTRLLMDYREREMLKAGGVHGKAAVKEFRAEMKARRDELLRKMDECRKNEEAGMSDEEKKERRRKRRNEKRRAKRRNAKLARMRARQDAKRFTSKRKVALGRKCWNKQMDYMHKASAKLVSHLVSNNVSVLFIGKNKNWKQEANLTRAAKQNFERMPIARFLDMVDYKCRLHGIRVVYVEESHTSKCSFLDGENIGHHDSYVGKRIKRGLFRSANGTLINADLNGALNIMRKEIGDFNYPIEVCSAPVALAIKA